MQDVLFFEETKKQKGKFLLRHTAVKENKMKRERPLIFLKITVPNIYKKILGNKATIEISCRLKIPTAHTAVIF